jgi:RNA polymerase sigma factor (sigma-70 family)
MAGGAVTGYNPLNRRFAGQHREFNMPKKTVGAGDGGGDLGASPWPRAELEARREELCRRAARRLRNQAEAEDIAQRCVWNAWLAWNREPARQPPTPSRRARYVRTVYRRLIHKFTAAQHAFAPLSDLPEPARCAPVSSISKPEREQYRQRLTQLRARLSPEDQLIFDLKSQGHESKVIAQKLGKTPSGVRKRLERMIDGMTDAASAWATQGKGSR